MATVRRLRCGRSDLVCSSLAIPRRRQTACAAQLDIGKNPQNVENCKIGPNTEFSPEEAVVVQLEAIKDNCDPWYNHGLLTMYEFGEDVGGMERSRYFGFSKDLYHFDHFMGTFSTRFGKLFDHESFEITSSNCPAPGFHEVFVTVQCDSSTVMNLMFIMKMKETGLKKGCWMTACLKIIDTEEA